jgi:exodeoxyribonuclease VII large subunit
MGERARLGRAAVVHELAVRRVAIARTDVATAGAALAVLGPQATLERGYAIVRRAGDGAIVRDPAEAPPTTRLDVRVAHGSLPATVDESGGS